MSRGDIREGRAFERFINFTDAVVAIAITLMALPLIDIEGPGPDETIWQVIGANSGTLLVFLFAFAIVANSWYQHNRIVNDMRGYNAAVFWLNIAWIAVIAVIPWAANLYGSAADRFEGGEGLGGTGLFFYLLLATITFIGFLISRYVNRHPELLEPDRADRWRADRSVSDAIALTLIITFVAIGVASLFFPTISSYLPLLLIPLVRFMSVRRFRSAADGA